MLTYGIFLFFDIFFIIHAKGLAHVPEEQMENTELMPLGMAKELDENEYPSFELCLSDNWDSPLVAQHKQWLKTIRHETPNPKIPFKVAVYIRYFNQTKYDDITCLTEPYLSFFDMYRSSVSFEIWESQISNTEGHDNENKIFE